jgi:TRAP-type uncharacterized transport system fused permease subunit
MLGAGLIGYLRQPTRPWERALLLGGALALIFPGVLSDVLGAASGLTVFLSQRRRTPSAAMPHETVMRKAQT